eukprot:1139020-Amorphochlora_amoeboformis.AAC.1
MPRSRPLRAIHRGYHARKVSRNGSAEKEAEIIEGGKGRDSKRARRLFGSLEGKSRWISPSWGHR